MRSTVWVRHLTWSCLRAKYEYERGLEPAYHWPATNNNARRDTRTLFTYFGSLKTKVVECIQKHYARALWRRRHSMRSGDYATVCRPIDRQQQRRPAGLLLSSGICSRYRSIATGADADQRTRVVHGLGWPMGWVGLGRDFSVFGALGWVGSTAAKVLEVERIILMHLKHG